MKSRISLLEKPLPKAPKKCLVTGRADGVIVDFGTDVQFPMPQPHVYLKATVVEEAAVLLEMVPKEEVDELRNELERLSDELADLRGIADAIDSVRDADTQLQEAVSNAHSFSQ